VFLSIEDVSERLRKTGYIADSIATTTVYLAAKLHKPLLLEGPAGSGKTQLAYAVADAADTTVERLQCYEGINEEKAIGKFDESLQRLCVELKAKSVSVDWELVERNGIGDTADSVWRALSTGHQQLFPGRSRSDDDGSASTEMPGILLETQSAPAGLVESAMDTASVVVFGQRPQSLSRKKRRDRLAVPEQASLFGL